jgi:tetratricopeptide (TPR) repeat protein
MTYRQYRDMVRCHDALAFRWLVSSSSALTTALLSVGRVEQAEDVADGALRLVIHPGFNPMAHQNYTLLLFQAGLIKAWFERYDEAASLFIGAVNASRYGMVDLLHPQNNWVLGQMNDCLKFLHVAEAAYLAAVACTQNKLPPPSRFAPLSSAPKLKINFSTLFERFGCFKSGSPAFFGQVLLKMQAHQDS